MIDIAKKYCRQLGVNVSFHMPTGYEEAFGTYDVTCNTIYINKNLAQSTPPYRFLFFFLHEYRHAVQYNNPSAFSDEIQKSLPYVILYNGECFKLSRNSGKNVHCREKNGISPTPTSVYPTKRQQICLGRVRKTLSRTKVRFAKVV